VNKVRDTEACAESAENRFEKNEHVKRYMENEGIAQTATPFLLFTSPSPCGRSFLASNIGVANASEGKKILLIDFSKDAGSLSYVNPSIEEESNGWIRYETKLVPYLTIIVMSENNMATVDEVIKQVLFWSENYAMVLVDVPWEHPWRERLCSIGKPIAIVDSDYHHWVQWERATRWSGEVWLNQSEIDMTPLIQEVWGVTPSRMFPTFQQAKKSLYRGRPLALEENMRENFLLPHDWFQ
ncbi:hypothetical protein, partial [Brevibacillus sp. SYSU BS000544]|uniref:hypothetical protein n=1 Tax=Brevibacillus sp. SYSU BS000544 TaxID=3416443 RepID=UPI003CE47D1A